MRKSIFAVCALMIVAFMASCDKEPTMIGKWKAEDIKEETKNNELEKASLIYSMDLLEDSSMVLDLKATIDGTSTDEGKKMTMHFPMNSGFMGKWTADETTLKWIPTDSTRYFSIDKDSMKITFDDPAMEAFADKIIKSTVENLEKEQGKEFLGELNTTWNYKFEGDKLTLMSDKDTINFVRQSEKK